MSVLNPKLNMHNLEMKGKEDGRMKVTEEKKGKGIKISINQS